MQKSYSRMWIFEFQVHIFNRTSVDQKLRVATGKSLYRGKGNVPHVKSSTNCGGLGCFFLSCNPLSLLPLPWWGPHLLCLLILACYIVGIPSHNSAVGKVSMLMMSQVAGLVVELRIRVYDIYVCVHLPKHKRVIGPISSGYVSLLYPSMNELNFFLRLAHLWCTS